MIEAFRHIFVESWPAKLAIGFLTFVFGGWQEAYGALILLVLLDIASGMYASRRQGRSITSRRMREGLVTKFVTYPASIAAMNLAEVGMHTGGLFLTLLLGFLCLTEAISVLENLSRVYPDHPGLRFAMRLLGQQRGDLERKGGRDENSNA